MDGMFMPMARERKNIMTIKERARGLKRDIPAIFIAFRKKETPWMAKCMAAITICYALSPIDFIPDFIPVLGYLDDIILLPILVVFTIKLIPKEVYALCKEEAEHIWDNGKPKKWIYAIPIIMFWCLLLAFVFYFLFL